MPGKALRPHSKGVVVSVKAAPSSGKAALEQRRDGALSLRLKSPPEKGRANKEALAFLSRLFKAPVSLVSGGTGRRKDFLVQGLDITRASGIIKNELARSRK